MTLNREQKILSILYQLERPDVPKPDIETISGIDSTNSSKIINKLVNEGLITTDKVQFGRKRIRFLTLTEKGLKQASELPEQFDMSTAIIEPIELPKTKKGKKPEPEPEPELPEIIEAIEPIPIKEPEIIVKGKDLTPSKLEAFDYWKSEFGKMKVEMNKLKRQYKEMIEKPTPEKKTIQVQIYKSANSIIAQVLRILVKKSQKSLTTEHEDRLIRICAGLDKEGKSSDTLRWVNNSLVLFLNYALKHGVIK